MKLGETLTLQDHIACCEDAYRRAQEYYGCEPVPNPEAGTVQQIGFTVFKRVEPNVWNVFARY